MIVFGGLDMYIVCKDCGKPDCEYGFEAPSITVGHDPELDGKIELPALKPIPAARGAVLSVSTGLQRLGPRPFRTAFLVRKFLL